MIRATINVFAGFRVRFSIPSELAARMQTLSPKAHCIRQDDQRAQARRLHRTSHAPCKAHYCTAAQPSGAGCRKHMCTMRAFHRRSSLQTRHNTRGSGRRKALLGTRAQKSREVLHKNFELWFNLASSVPGHNNPASIGEESFSAGKQLAMRTHLNAIFFINCQAGNIHVFSLCNNYWICCLNIINIFVDFRSCINIPGINS